MARYELVTPNIDERTGKPYPGFQEKILGAMLIQVLEGRKLRVEVFPGKTAEDVKGFTAAAMSYER